MKTLLIISIFCLAVILNVSGQTKPQEMLNKAIYQEEVNGNLEEAIKIYLEIVNNNSTNRTVTAEAFCHLGLTNEKLGNKKAMGYYEKVVNNFEDQPEFVRIAKERLSKLVVAEQVLETPKATTIQKVMSGETTIMWGAVSPNGRFLTYSDPKTLNLAIRELATGKKSIITNDAAENPDQFNMGSVISPDSKQIAYAWYKNNHEIRILDIDNPQPKTLYANKDEDIWPCAWSPDGKTIYARSILNNKGQSRLLAITISNGEIKILKSFDKIFWIKFSISHDNKFIAFNVINNKDAQKPNTDIHLLSTDGTTEVSLIEHPANDKILGWFPDKNKLLFKSNRSGTWDAWTVEVANGKISGDPVKVLSQIGANASPMGFTQKGTFYYSLFSRKFTGSVSQINQSSGELINESAITLSGSVRNAKWSPDGKSLALIKELWKENKRTLCILNTETGKEREVAEWLNTQFLAWSKDCINIITIGYDRRRESEKNYTGGMFTIEVESGKANELVSFSNPQINDGKAGLLWAQTIGDWNNDKSIYYIKNDQLIRRELDNGQEKILLQNQNLNKIPYKLDLSPDGKNLLFCHEEQIYIIPNPGGTQIPIAKLITSNSENNAVWSTDGNYIFYTQNKDDGSVLWRVSPDGKNPKEVWQSKFPISSLSIHPNGKKIVITDFSQGAEIWKADNLLSKEYTVNKQK